jgi:hypothetical protein
MGVGQCLPVTPHITGAPTERLPEWCHPQAICRADCWLSWNEAPGIVGGWSSRSCPPNLWRWDDTRVCVNLLSNHLVRKRKRISSGW